MKLLIMRHGEAQSYAASDAQRPLTAKGEQQAITAGQTLQSLGFKPDLVWHSPYIRASQTAAAVMAQLASSNKPIASQVSEFLQPDVNPSYVAEKIAAMVQGSQGQGLEGQASSMVETLLIVSHQPLVSALVGMLVEADTHLGPAMSPASMVMLEADELLTGCCALRWQRHAPLFIAQ